jgi:hypothetical protein
VLTASPGEDEADRKAGLLDHRGATIRRDAWPTTESMADGERQTLPAWRFPNRTLKTEYRAGQVAPRR